MPLNQLSFKKYFYICRKCFCFFERRSLYLKKQNHLLQYGIQMFISRCSRVTIIESRVESQAFDPESRQSLLKFFRAKCWDLPCSLLNIKPLQTLLFSWNIKPISQNRLTHKIVGSLPETNNSKKEVRLWSIIRPKIERKRVQLWNSFLAVLD